jgi:hypothetical protein
MSFESMSPGWFSAIQPLIVARCLSFGGSFASIDAVVDEISKGVHRSQ